MRHVTSDNFCCVIKSVRVRSPYSENADCEGLKLNPAIVATYGLFTGRCTALAHECGNHCMHSHEFNSYAVGVRGDTASQR